MKTKLVVVFSAIFAVTVLSACGVVLGQAAPEELFLDESKTGQQVEMVMDGTLTITLESNPTTGFRWDLVGISETNVMELTGNVFEGVENGLIGTGGKEVWTFKAIAQGHSTITLEYSRPWASGEKAEQTYEIVVIVK